MLDDNKPIRIEFENGSIIESLPNTGEVVRSKIKTYDDFCGMIIPKEENTVNNIIEKLKREINELSSKHKAIICDEDKSDEQIMADLISILNEGIESIKHNQLPQSIPILDYDLMVGGMDEI